MDCVNQAHGVSLADALTMVYLVAGIIKEWLVQRGYWYVDVLISLEIALVDSVP